MNTALRSLTIIKLLLLVLAVCSAIILPNCGGSNLPFAITTDSGSGAGRQGPWYEECIRRQAITISSVMTASDQLNFPVLIRITDQNNPMFDRTQPDGDDLYFTENDGTTRLDHEIEYFMNTGTKELVAWVKIPILSSTADTVIYMYYGDSDITSQENPAGVWSNNYGIVYHMDPQGIDSTSYGRNRVADIGSPAPDNTFLGLGMGFDGTSAWDQTNISYWEQGWDIRSHEVVFKTGSDISTEQSIFAEGGGANGVMLYIYNGSLYARWWSISEGWSGDYQSTSISPNTIYHVIMSFYFDPTLNPLITNDVYEMFVNGVSVGATVTPYTMSPHGGDGGVAYTGPAAKNFDHVSEQGDFFNGSIYEFRVRDAVTDINYAAATYNNQREPQSYLSLGAEELIECLGTWLFRQQITISAAMAPSDQMYFPALIKIADQNNPLFDKARMSGADILFTTSNGMTKLAHELEYYRNTTTKELDAWVRIPVLLSANDTIIYMYYGNPVSGNQETVDLVWGDADYAGIWHLSESAGNHADSTGSVQGVRNGNTAVAGQIGNGQLFNGSSDYINLGNSSHIYQYDNEFAVSAWIKRASTGTAQMVAARDNSDKGWRIMFMPTDQLRFIMVGDCCPIGPTWFIWTETVGMITDTDWHHIAVYYPGDGLPDSMEIYIDGAQAPVTPVVGSTLDQYYTFATEPDAGIGANTSNTDNFFDGSIDEVRIMINTVLMSDWMGANYNNQNNPAGFLTFDVEESY